VVAEFALEVVTLSVLRRDLSHAGKLPYPNQRLRGGSYQERRRGWNWQTQLNHMVRRDILTRTQFEEPCSQSGISNDRIVVFYGDNNDSCAAFTFWQFEYYGHKDGRPMNGRQEVGVGEAPADDRGSRDHSHKSQCQSNRPRCKGAS
jgi:hypothetical protein